jgi:glycosyltransferase involved in cell wall biosynthesis
MSGVPIRVLHVIHTLATGGTERHLVDLIRHSDRDELHHFVVALQEPDQLVEEVIAAGHDALNLRLPGAHPWARGVLGVRRVMHRFRPDVVHTWLYDGDITGRLAVTIGRSVPIVTGIQTAAYHPDAIRGAGWSPGKVRVLRAIDKVTALVSRCRFVALSEFAAEAHRVHFKAAAERIIAVIPNAVESRPIGDGPVALRRRLGIPTDAFVITMVGRLDRLKDQETLIRAFARAFGDDPAFHLVLFGEGPLRREFEELASTLGVADRVQMPGLERGVGAVYAMADLFVFTSLLEGMGMAPLEAMLAGTPCVISDIPTMREMVDDGRSGILFPPGRVDSLAAIMKDVAADPERRAALGRAAVTRAGDYTFAATMPQWLAVYRSLRDGSGSASTGPGKGVDVVRKRAS